MKKFIALVTATLVAGAILATILPAGATEVVGSWITVDVTKEVVNAPQQETDFIIKLTCSDHDDVESATQTVEWSSPGNSPWHLNPEDGQFTLSVYDNWDGDVSCVLSETSNGGAVTTTITCVDDTDAYCDGANLYIDENDLGHDQFTPYGEFVVVNDFTPVATTTTTAAVVTPPPTTAAPVTEAAPVIVIGPRFTG